ncbi:T6SS effector amidase Tae4 family protein [Methylomonas sp. BW4-1]|uniref:T6SS effector amidase Tae4 family protein n=1 Tax=Methylomonas sp. BW4-1 TaxID=3376685 RepID=UPI0040438162
MFQEISKQHLKKRLELYFLRITWQRGNESFQNRSGDHIDLWNKNELTGGGMFTRSVYEFFGVVSDLNKSKEVWFWEIK